MKPLLWAVLVAGCFNAWNIAAAPVTSRAVAGNAARSNASLTTNTTHDTPLSVVRPLQKRILPEAPSAEDYQRFKSIGKALTRLSLLEENEANRDMNLETRKLQSRGAGKGWTASRPNALYYGSYDTLLTHVGHSNDPNGAQQWRLRQWTKVGAATP